eukprot:Tamp_00419.p2 GENE.Tamp_00419~~Tamp_00419.p2  ORF type:complete len:812 (+),score=121.20 Tamp_00419:240-2675(+)
MSAFLAKLAKVIAAGGTPEKPRERIPHCVLCGNGNFSTKRPPMKDAPHCFNSECPYYACAHACCLGHATQVFDEELIQRRPTLLDKEDIPEGWDSKVSALQYAALNAGISLEGGKFSLAAQEAFLEAMDDTDEGAFCVESTPTLAEGDEASGATVRLRIIGIEAHGGVRFCCSGECTMSVQEKMKRRDAGSPGMSLRSASRRAARQAQGSGEREEQRSAASSRVSAPVRNVDELEGQEQDGANDRARADIRRNWDAILAAEGDDIDLDKLVPNDPAFPDIRTDLQALATPRVSTTADTVPPASRKGGMLGDVSPGLIQQPTATLSEIHDPGVAELAGLEPGLAELLRSLRALDLSDYLQASALTSVEDLKMLSLAEQREFKERVPGQIFGLQVKLQRVFDLLGPGTGSDGLPPLLEVPEVGTGAGSALRTLAASEAGELRMSASEPRPDEVPARKGASGGAKWPPTSDLSPQNAQVWAAMLAAGQDPSQVDPDVRSRLQRGLPIPPFCVSTVAGAPHQPTKEDLRTLFAVDLTVTAQTSGNLCSREVPSLFPKKLVLLHFRLMRNSGLFRGQENDTANTQLEMHGDSQVLSTTVRLSAQPIPLEDWDVALMEVYFKHMLYSLNYLELHHLVPALLWVQAWSFGRDMCDLGASVSSGFKYDDGMADRMLNLRKQKLRHLREMITGERSRTEHPASSWLVVRTEQNDWAREGLGQDQQSESLRVPGPLLPRPMNVPVFAPEDVWNNKVCLNCAGPHCVYECMLPRKPNLPCTNCFWGVHHESSCSGQDLHPLKHFQALKAQDAVKRRKEHKGK